MKTLIVCDICLICLTVCHLNQFVFSARLTAGKTYEEELLVDRLIDRILQQMPNRTLKQQVQHLRASRDYAALARLGNLLQKPAVDRDNPQQLDQLLEQSVRNGHPERVDQTLNGLLKRLQDIRWIGKSTVLPAIGRNSHKIFKKRPNKIMGNQKEQTAAQSKVAIDSYTLSNGPSYQKMEIANIPIAEGLVAVLLGKLIGMKVGFLASKLGKSTCPTPIEEEIIITEEVAAGVATDLPARDELLSEDSGQQSMPAVTTVIRRRGKKRRRKVIRFHHNGNVRRIRIYRRRRKPGSNRLRPTSTQVEENSMEQPLNSAYGTEDNIPDQDSPPPLTEEEHNSRRNHRHRLFSGDYEYSP